MAFFFLLFYYQLSEHIIWSHLMPTSTSFQILPAHRGLKRMHIFHFKNDQNWPPQKSSGHFSSKNFVLQDLYKIFCSIISFWSTVSFYGSTLTMSEGIKSQKRCAPVRESPFWKSQQSAVFMDGYSQASSSKNGKNCVRKKRVEQLSELDCLLGLVSSLLWEINVWARKSSLVSRSASKSILATEHSNVRSKSSPN